MKNKIIALVPLVIATTGNGIIFFDILETGLFNWRLYMSMSGFLILLALTIWFSILFYKRHTL